MNKIYRLIWSEITRTWVAVSEITRGRGKRASGVVGHPVDTVFNVKRFLHNLVDTVVEF